ncbi:MAG: energy-coupling factor transporter transmembrane protein EcfT [Chloroflexi bacterium]|nr:energy-coupling factor transporter transmembrane protein EcfT [Chloroflexota bacterium]
MARQRLAYRPGRSWLHRLHPLVKLGWLALLSLALFVAPTGALVAVTLAVALLALWATGLRSWREFPGLRLLLPTCALLFVLQALFRREGEVVVRLWPFGGGALPVTDAGLAVGWLISGRFLAIILLSYALLLSTEPNDLAYALMAAGLPYRYGFMLVTALRLMPIFELEGNTVYDAQLARGVRYDARSPLRLLTLLRRLLLPLLVSALGKVDALAVSMEGRGFGQYPDRTFLREVRMSRRDWWAAAWLALAAVALVVWWVSGG